MSNISTEWAGLLNRRDVIILDTETTGLSKTAEVVGIALLNTRSEIVLDQHILPEGRITKKASEIHGLTRERLRSLEARPWPEVHEEFIAALSGATCLVIYNADFDLRLLRQTTEKHGLGLPDLPNIRCAMRDYAAFRRVPDRREGEWKWHRLEAAHNHETGEERTQQHRALDDCQMTLALMEAVAAKTKTKSDDKYLLYDQDKDGSAAKTETKSDAVNRGDWSWVLLVLLFLALSPFLLNALDWSLFLLKVLGWVVLSLFLLKVLVLGGWALLVLLFLALLIWGLG